MLGNFVVPTQPQWVLLYSDAPISYAVPFLVGLQTLYRKFDTLNWLLPKFLVTSHIISILQLAIYHV